MDQARKLAATHKVLDDRKKSFSLPEHDGERSVVITEEAEHPVPEVDWVARHDRLRLTPGRHREERLYAGQELYIAIVFVLPLQTRIDAEVPVQVVLRAVPLQVLDVGVE